MKFQRLAHYYGLNKRITETITGKIKHVTLKTLIQLLLLLNIH